MLIIFVLSLVLAGVTKDAKSFIREITLSNNVTEVTSINAHMIAGVISAILLAIAFVICSCVAISRRKLFIGSGQSSESVDIDSKDDSKIYTSLRSGFTGYKKDAYGRKESVSTPIKRSKSQSAASLASQPTIDDNYEIYPYATFGLVI